jgi:hypothetical protein
MSISAVFHYLMHTQFDALLPESKFVWFLVSKTIWYAHDVAVFKENRLLWQLLNDGLLKNTTTIPISPSEKVLQKIKSESSSATSTDIS